MAARNSGSPRAWVYSVLPWLIAATAARAIGSGVGKSGSPTSMWMMSRPSASSWRARVSSSTTWKGLISARRRAGRYMRFSKTNGHPQVAVRLSLKCCLRGVLEDAHFEQFALQHEFARHLFAHLVEPLLVASQFGLPGICIDAGQRFEIILVDFQAIPVQVFELRHPAEDGFLGGDGALAALNDPLQDAHVVAEARPHEVAVGIHA